MAKIAKTQLNIDTLKTEAVKPLFAVAGATEIAVDFARGYATEAQKTATTRLADVKASVAKVDRDPKTYQAKASSLVDARVEKLTKDAKDAQVKFEARLAELQTEAKALPAKAQAQISEAIAELTKTYDELVARGEKFVAAVRKDGVKAVTTTTKKAPVKKAAAAKKAPAKKAPAKKAAAKTASA